MLRKANDELIFELRGHFISFSANHDEVRKDFIKKEVDILKKNRISY